MSALVGYGSSSEDGDAAPQSKRPRLSPPKQQLPALPASFSNGPAQPDDPANHDGRQRTLAYRDGDFAAHVYINLELPSSLLNLIKEVVSFCKNEDPAWKNLLHTAKGEDSEAEEDGAFVHVSLSRTFALRRHQIENFKHALAQLVAVKSSFALSFTQFEQFENENGTRSFLSMLCGLGHSEMEGLASGVSRIIEKLKQEIYFEEPQFHASFAWKLKSAEKLSADMSPVMGDSRLLDALQKQFGSRISSSQHISLSSAILGATTLHVRIGQKVFVYPLK